VTKNYEIERACAELEAEVERLKQQHDETWLVYGILCHKTFFFKKIIVYTPRSVNGQDEPNTAMWLATLAQACK